MYAAYVFSCPPPFLWGNTRQVFCVGACSSITPPSFNGGGGGVGAGAVHVPVGLKLELRGRL